MTTHGLLTYSLLNKSKNKQSHIHLVIYIIASRKWFRKAGRTVFRLCVWIAFGVQSLASIFIQGASLLLRNQNQTPEEISLLWNLFWSFLLRNHEGFTWLFSSNQSRVDLGIRTSFIHSIRILILFLSAACVKRAQFLKLHSNILRIVENFDIWVLESSNVKVKKWQT